MPAKNYQQSSLCHLRLTLQRMLSSKYKGPTKTPLYQAFQRSSFGGKSSPSFSYSASSSKIAETPSPFHSNKPKTISIHSAHHPIDKHHLIIDFPCVQIFFCHFSTSLLFCIFYKSVTVPLCPIVCPFYVTNSSHTFL